MKMKVVLVAEESAGIHALRCISKHRCELVGVFTSEAHGPPGLASVADAARKQGIAVWPAAELTTVEAAERLAPLDVDLLINVHSLCIIHPSLLEVATIGSFNLHPGPLPAYAGLNVPSWAIYNGEIRHAVTLHWMLPEIDTGPIAYESWFDIGDESTGLSVSRECVRRGIQLIDVMLTVAQNCPKGIPARHQNLRDRRLFLGNDVPHSGLVPWKESAELIERMVRAADFYPLSSPWGHPLTYKESMPLRLVKARNTSQSADDPYGTVVHVTPREAWVATGDSLLAISKLIHGGKMSSATDLLEVGMQLT
jgi:methionyl-tRNA formyltransferase